MVRRNAIVLLFLGALIGVSAFALPIQWGPEEGNRPADVYANGKDYFLGQAIIQFNRVLPDLYNTDGTTVVTGVPEIDAFFKKYGVYFLRDLTPLEKAPTDGNVDCRWFFWLQFPPEKSMDAFLADAKKLSYAITVDPNYIRDLYFTPNDPSQNYSNEWDLAVTHCPQAWDYTSGDSTIVIAIVDCGMDMTHEDLASNLWVNPAEDLNGDGIIEANEHNGVDNGNNGYVDDFYGWNFTSNNNNPQDNIYWTTGGHGTHVAGCADARTNNGVGVAAPARVARIMVLRCAANTSDDEHIGDTFAMSAWSYARNMGANIMNNSWGSFSPSNGEQTLMTSCYNAGMMVFCAAGNDGDSTHAAAIAPHYPAALTNAISIAASTSDDSKASFSNYGLWVKLTAPGEHILSTVYTSTHHDYDFADGTSMASPVAAGSAALLWSVMAGADRNTVRDVLAATATRIQYSRYGDSLGAGRIDVGRAVASQFPGDSLVSFIVRDTINGIPNGRAEAGDTVCFDISFANTTGHVAGSNCYFKVYSDDPNLIAIHDSVYIGNRPVGANAGTNQIKFRATTSLIPHRIQLRIDVGGKNPYLVSYRKEFVQPVMLGFANVLLVDDDGGASYEAYYETPLDSLNESWDEWNVALMGVPDTALFMHYDNIFWFTGDRMSNVLTATEEDRIIWLQNHNKHLLFSSQGAASDMGTTAFHQQWLHATTTGIINEHRLTGVTNDPLGAGMSLYTVGAGAGGSGSLIASNVLVPTAGAATAWSYSTSGSSGVVYTTTTYGRIIFIYCGFPVEAINASDAGGYYVPHTLFFQRVLSQFRLGVAEPIKGTLPTTYALNTPYPNPFNPTTTIQFELPKAGSVKLTVFDATGRTVTTLLDGNQPAGKFSLKWNASQMASGLYFIRMQAGSHVLTQKAMLVK